MPSSQPEVPVRLLQKNPYVARQRFGRPELVPPYKEMLPVAEVHTNGKPTQLVSDNVEVGVDEKGNIALRLIVEIQKQPDPKKKRRWLGCLADLAIRLECSVALIVIALNDNLARWCRKPFEVGHPGLKLTPVEVGPDEIPVINNVSDAVGNLELTVLSALAHASEPGGTKILDALDIVLLDLPPDEAVEDAYDPLSILDDEARGQMEALMATQTYDYQSRWAEKFRAEGGKRGLERGMLGHVQTMFWTVIAARGFELSARQKAIVDNGEDTDHRDQWAAKAVTAASIDDVFNS